jgi:hypothetical protein
MGWVYLIHLFLGFLMISINRAHRAFGGSFSLVCSPKELGEGNGSIGRGELGEGNGSIGRGELGRLLSWRAHEGLGPSLFVVITLAWRRAHHRRGAHN